MIRNPSLPFPILERYTPPTKPEKIVIFQLNSIHYEMIQILPIKRSDQNRGSLLK
jgi:hypothetical protein